jgi:hypothetical protein
VTEVLAMLSIEYWSVTLPCPFRISF